MQWEIESESPFDEWEVESEAPIATASPPAPAAPVDYMTAATLGMNDRRARPAPAPDPRRNIQQLRQQPGFFDHKAPFRDKQEAIDDAVDRIELGQPAEDVFKAFEQAGVTRDEIIARGRSLGGPAFQQRDQAGGRVRTEPSAPSGELKNLRGEGGTVASRVQDVAAAGGRGVVVGFKAIADSFGADNTTSRRLEAADRYIEGLRSVAATEDDEEVSRILEEAKGEGVFASIAAGARAFAVDPASMIAQGLGTSVPTILSMLLPGARESRLAQIAYGAASGAVQGAGIAKSSIKEEVVEELVAAGYTRAEAEERGELAQRYLGENADSIALQTLLGTASVLGVERIGTGAIRNILSNGATADSLKLLVKDGVLKRGAKTAAEEAAPEFAQGFAEQVGGNVAVQREGFERDTFEGAVAAGTMEALAGAGAGGIVGAASGPLRVDNSDEAQFARALAMDTSDVWQGYTENAREADVDGFAQRALSPFSSLNSPSAVDARMDGQARRAPRVEEMPTEVISPEELEAIRQEADAAALAARPASAEEPPGAAQPAADQPQAAPAAGPAVGVANVPQGDLAERARAVANPQALERGTVAPGAARVAPGATPAAAPATTGATPAASQAPAIESLRQRYDTQRRDRIRSAQRLEEQAREVAATGLPQVAERLQERARSIRLEAARLPQMAPPQQGPALQQFNRLADAMERTMGARPVAYEDTSSAAADGFFDTGVNATFVNIAMPEMPVVSTVIHEFSHAMKRRADQGDAGAQRAQQALDRVWEMISDAGKKSYAEKYLFKAQGLTVDQVMADPESLALLKEEMLADFMGKRATDKRFMQKLAKREPELFGDFVREWLDILRNMIADLAGTGGAGQKNIDKYLVGRLEEAKSVAETVMIEWARANPRLAQDKGIDPDIARFEGEGGRFASLRSQPPGRRMPPPMDMSPEDAPGIDPDISDSELMGSFNEFLSGDWEPDDTASVEPQPFSAAPAAAPAPAGRARTFGTAEDAIRFISQETGKSEAEVRQEWGYSNPQDYIILAEDIAYQGAGADVSAPPSDSTIPAGETSELSEAERQAVMSELMEEQNRVAQATPVVVMPQQTFPPSEVYVSYDTISDKELRQAGIMAEQAFPAPVYEVTPDGSHVVATVEVAGRKYRSRLRNSVEARAEAPSSIVRNSLNTAAPGESISGINLTIDGAKAWFARFAASGALFKRGFDLSTAIKPDARKRVEAVWTAVSRAPGAFEFNKETVAKGRDNSEIVQSIADSMLAGSRWRAQAKRTDYAGNDDSVRVSIYKGSDYMGDAVIEYERPRGGKPAAAVMHTTGFTKGSGAGKPFYQIAFAFADARNATVSADPYGLLAVNGYRRTEQQFSAALRTGKTSNVQPGYGQRVYGWNARVKDQKQGARNIVRLALAAARNAAEFFPGIVDLRYDPETDSFSFPDGTSADTTVELALLSPDVRQVSISRSTLARAAITFGAIRGDIDVSSLRSVKKPVLYSARAPQPEVEQPPAETPAQQPEAQPEAQPVRGRPTRYQSAGGRIRRTVEELVAYAQSMSNWRDWYERHVETLQEMFGDDAQLFSDMLAATSQAATVPSNVALALKAYRQFYAGEPFTGYLPAVIKNLERLRVQSYLAGPKINAYGAANAGDITAIAVDRHIAELMFNTGRPNQRQIDAAKRRIITVAQRLGWTPREVQSALWAYNQVRKGRDPNEVQSYDTLLRRRQSEVIEVRRLAEVARAEGRGVREPRLLAGRRNRPSGVQGAARTRDEPGGQPDLEVTAEGVDLAEDRGSISFSARAKPTYASRPVQNASDIVAWARSQGFTSVVNPEELHVTIAFSREPIDASTVPAAPQSLLVATGRRSVEQLGDEGAVVLMIESPELQQRWQQYRDAGASWDYDSYRPHITITYDAKGMDLSKVQPYRGAIVLGAEVAEDLNTEARGELLEAEMPVRPPYSDAPDTLMGFSRTGPQKAFGQQKYKHVQYVRLTFEDGSADSFVDAMAGLNKAHAMERARRNWPTLSVAAISKEEALREDPGIEQAVNDAMAAGGLLFSTRRGRFKLGDFGYGSRIIEAHQDRYNRWKQAIREIEEQGGTVSEDNDFYQAEERYWGKVGAQLEDFQEEVEAWTKEVAADGVDLGSVAEYAYAEHAKDRNAWIAQQRTSMPDGGSGMTNDEADLVFAEARAAGVEPQLKKHAARLRAWVQGTRDLMLREGLITQEEYDAWTLNMASYVPLRGLPPDSDLEGIGQSRGTGQGFNIRGREAKEAKGRRSRAKQIIEHIIADRTKAHVRAGKNEVLRHFLKFVLDNPSPNLWEVNAVEKKAITRVDANGDRQIIEEDRIISDDRVVTVKDAGNEIHIVVRDEKLREQLQNLHVQNVGKTIGALLFVNRILSRLYTSLSPVFTIVNFARDTITAGFGAIDELGFFGAGRMYANFPKAAWESFRAEAGTRSPDYEEFRRTGGKTGFFDFKTVDDLSIQINRMVASAERGWLDPRNLGPKMLDIIEAANAGFENVARLAVFKTAKQMGRSTAEAARISKNLTVNFNRKGTVTPAMSAWFLFYNPAVQGTTRMLQALANPKVISTLGLAMTGMAALALRNAAMGEDDDGIPWWDKIPDEVKERNIIIVHPPGSTEGEEVPGSKYGRYTKIPMPYGYNFFAVVANQLVDVWRNSQDPRHGREPWAAFKEAFGAFMGSWVPVAEIGGSFENEKAAALVFVPDGLNPIVQNLMNVNPFGRPIAPESMGNEGLPDSSRYFAGQAGTFFQRAAEGLNETTGGTAIEPGLIDLTPGAIENLVRGYLGGPATFTMDILNSVYAKQHLDRPELDVRRLPFVKQVIGRIDEETDRMIGYSNMEKATRMVNRFNAAKKLEELSDEEAAYLEANSPMMSLGRTLNATRKALSDLRKEELAILNNDELSDGDKLAQMLLLNKERRQALQFFNQAYGAAQIEQRRLQQEEQRQPAPAR